MILLTAADGSIFASQLHCCHFRLNRAFEANCPLLQLVPSREAFLEKLGTPNEELYQQMNAFLNAFQPVLQDVHKFFVEHNLDDPARV